MKSYDLDLRLNRYGVMQSNGVKAYRRTRSAAGMMATAIRSGHNLEGDALILACNGTTDLLAYTLGNKMKKYRSKHYHAQTITRWVKK